MTDTRPRAHDLPDGPADDDGRTVLAVERAIAVLEAFDKERLTLTLPQLVARTRTSKATVERLLLTLERLGYVQQDAAGGYRPGPAPLRLGRLFQRAVREDKLIVATLEGLVAHTGESAAYHVPISGGRLCMYRIDSPQVIRDHYRAGEELPLRGAAGRLFLAFRKPFEARFDADRRALVVVSIGGLHADTAGIAAPIFDEFGDIRGALTISGPAARFGHGEVARHRALIARHAERLTLALGGDADAYARLTSNPSSERDRD